jgi:cobalamin biosynthesis protein CobD/CbiB
VTVRSINLLKIAAEAELLRLRTMMARQVRRGIFGAIAVVFGVVVLALVEVVGWQALRLKFQPIPATLILLGVNLAIAAVFGVLAARSTPSHTEHEALEVRQRALEAARGSLVFTAALPTARLLRGGRTRGRGSWRSFLGR